MHKALMILVCSILFIVPAFADSVSVSYSSTSLGPFSFQADTFSLTGQSGVLTLDSSVLTTAAINTAVFFTGDSGTFSGTESGTLIYGLTLDGVTQAVGQMATWTITPSQDTFVSVGASSPVLFNTAQGSWLVTLDGYSLSSTTIGLTQTTATSADFVPVPEPGTLALLGSGLLLVAGKLRRKAVQGQA